MGSREDGVPAEILNFSPDSFQENLRLLINTVFASEFKMPKETLSAKVILLYKKGNPSLLVSYRPIALLTSTYQLMNLMLAGRLQDLAERNGLFAMGSSYVLTSTMPTLSTLRAMLAFGPFWISSGSLILTCLRTSTIWPPCGSAWGRKRLRTYSWTPGRPRVLPSPRCCSSCSSTPFCACSTTLNSTTGCRVRLVSDDLSLYLKFEANANRLLAKVHLFEKWSGLCIALTKSFVTAVTHGREAESRASEATRGHLAQSRMDPRAHPWVLIAMEEDNENRLLLRQFRSNAATTNRCIKCQKDKPLDRFPLAPSSSENCATTCISCKSQWLPSGILYNGNPLPVIPGSSPTRFLGIHGDMEGDCSTQISLIFQQSTSIIAFLQQKKLGSSDATVPLARPSRLGSLSLLVSLGPPSSWLPQSHRIH
jgi:hypothetical protein